MALYILARSAYPTLAATIHVPADYPTIQECIENAVAGDSCLVAPGTYVESINFLGKAITVRSEAGAEATAIDGNQEERRPVAFAGGETEDSVIDGFTICNGRVCHGGGIYCCSSSPTITNCTISGNKSSSRGGGIICESGSSPEITNCIISGNVSGYGGAIYCDDSDPTITHCTISGNTAIIGGGGICSYRNSSPLIVNSILWGNSAPFGPEIYTVTASAVVMYSDVQGGWPGEGNIGSDPLFLGGGDYHLTFRSPCIDSGTEAGIHTDTHGAVRPQGAGFDIGAHEYPDCWDGDMDGFGDVACEGYDCDDVNPKVNPRSVEICEGGVDEDCDGLVDDGDPGCAEFCLELDASYGQDKLSLDFTLGAPEQARWETFLLLTYPTVQVVRLWSVAQPATDPPIDMLIAFAFPSMDWIMIYSALFVAWDPKAVVLEWVDTGTPTTTTQPQSTTTTTILPSSTTTTSTTTSTTTTTTTSITTTTTTIPPPCEYVSVTVIPLDEEGEERTAGALAVAIEWDESIAVVGGYIPSSRWFGLNDISHPSTWTTGRVHILAIREPGSLGEVHIGDICFRKVCPGNTELIDTLEVLVTTFGDGLEDITEYSRAELTHESI